jgi:hypothetical protein
MQTGVDFGAGHDSWILAQRRRIEKVKPTPVAAVYDRRFLHISPAGKEPAIIHRRYRYSFVRPANA